MASEKPKHKEGIPASDALPQINEELGFDSISNEAVYSTGIFDAIPNINMLSSPHSQFTDVHNMPQSYSQEIPLNDFDLMSDVSQFDSSQISEIYPNSLYGPVSDIPHLKGNFIEMCQLPTLSHSVDSNTVIAAATNANALQDHQTDRNHVTASDNALRCLQMGRQGVEANTRNTDWPHLTGSSICHEGSTPMSGHETGTDNKGLISVVHSSYPEKLDGSILTLGVGGDTVARSNFNVSSRNITHKAGRNVHPQLDSSCCQTDATSYLNHSVTGHGFSSCQSNAGGISSVAQNVGEHTDLVQNVGRLTERPSLSFKNLRLANSNSTGFNLGSSLVSQMPQVDNHQYNTPNNWNLGLGEDIDLRFENVDDRRVFQSYQAISSVPFNSTQAGVPYSRQLRVPEWTSLSSSMTKKTTPPASVQLQQRYTGSPGSFLSEFNKVSPPLGIAKSNTKLNQSGQVMPVANKSGPSQASNVHVKPSLKRVATQPPLENESGPSQGSNVLVRPSHKRSATQPLPANESGPSEASNVLVRPPRKRGGTKPHPATPEGQCRKARTRIYSRPSIPSLAQSAPSVKPLAPTTLQHLARTTPSPITMTIPPIHIKWQDPDGNSRFSELKCVLCKRDLSYVPDGPFMQPAVPPAVAVLPCGHCFHDDCLKRITPKDQAENPPCIPCVIGEG
ncbi:hypothetical protein CFOL_v3_14952 [Cephalotus follicularis]|uniref:RING-type domain-containing protein n=1 Tax=Cephalotus follicularis TaxID=3775 RepID=A0A1Q3BU78_CEPFO|nr:hypothetical protein CFOL_v3_14952 [Cephalotus follicularis]